MTTSTMKHRFWIERIAAVFIVLAVWQAVAMVLAQPLLLASPVQVIQRLGTIWMEPEFLEAVIYSCSRIAVGFLLSFILGIVLGVLAGKFHLVEVLLWPLMLAVKTVPVVAIILICLIWMTSNQLTAFIVMLMVVPLIYANTLEAIKSTDWKMLQMANIFHVPFAKRLIYIYLPQIKPFLISACSVSLGVSWKSGIAAEVLSIPDGSIGELMHEAKVYFVTVDLLTWTLIVVLLSLLFEKVCMKLLDVFFARLEKL